MLRALKVYHERKIALATTKDPTDLAKALTLNPVELLMRHPCADDGKHRYRSRRNRTEKPVLNLRLAVALLAFLAVAGCAGANGSSTVASISNIEVGMTEGQVLSILGQPRVRESYGGTSFLFYADTAGTSIPIAIVDGRVTSIGRAAYDIVVRSQAQSTGSVRR
jgi:hypothetical protein